MIIVSDTSPLNYLVLIGEIAILQKLAGQVIIPQAVYHELQDRIPRSKLKTGLTPVLRGLKFGRLIFLFTLQRKISGPENARLLPWRWNCALTPCCLTIETG